MNNENILDFIFTLLFYLSGSVSFMVPFYFFLPIYKSLTFFTRHK